jgi:dipeptidyl aminopeptidase/acylaminoacyl peptidase
MGHSAGAYNAMMLVVEPKYLQSVNMQPSDIKAFVGISGPYDFLPLTSGTLKKIFKPAADIKDTQPITYASHAKTPPMLLLSDKHDWVVYPKNTRNMAKALQEAGNEVEVKYYNGAGHIGIVASFATVLYFENVPILDDVDTFLKKFANGE